MTPEVLGQGTKGALFKKSNNNNNKAHKMLFWAFVEFEKLDSGYLRCSWLGSPSLPTLPTPPVSPLMLCGAGQLQEGHVQTSSALC